MKKRILFLTMIIALSLTSLTGCSYMKEYLGEKMLQKAEVADDVNYKNYKEYTLSGRLDEDGYYVEENDEIASEQSPITVTFSENNNLTVRYYEDSMHQTEIDVSNCYLNPGVYSGAAEHVARSM